MNSTRANDASGQGLENDFEKAAPLSEESVSVFRDIRGGISLSETLITLGRIRLAEGNVERAKSCLYEALELAWNEGPRWLLVWALEVLAWFLGEQGQSEKAATFLSVVDSQRRTVHAPLRKADLLYHNTAITKARGALGQAVFERLWQEAKTLPLTEVMTMALKQVEL